MTSKTELNPDWHHIDAKGKVLGRIAADIANLLQGKDKVNYVPYLNSGDKVVVTNVGKVALTGNKELDKQYITHSGKVGNLKTRNTKQVRKNNPQRLIRDAVKGMLPKNKLRDVRLANLYLYEGEENPHQAQTGQNNK